MSSLMRLRNAEHSWSNYTMLGRPLRSERAQVSTRREGWRSTPRTAGKSTAHRSWIRITLGRTYTWRSFRSISSRWTLRPWPRTYESKSLKLPSDAAIDAASPLGGSLRVSGSTSSRSQCLSWIGTRSRNTSTSTFSYTSQTTSASLKIMSEFTSCWPN